MSEQRNDFTPEQQAVTIPFFLHENEMTRLERLNKRWFIAFLIVIVMLFVTNAGWIIYENQFQDEMYSYEFSQDSGEGGDNQYSNNRIIIGGDYHGETDSEGGSEAQGAESISGSEDLS